MRKKKKHDKELLLAKSKLNRIEVLIFMALKDWNINHDEFVLINNVLKEYEDMEEEIKNLKTKLSMLASHPLYLARVNLLKILVYL